jgi:hypothetical protein
MKSQRTWCLCLVFTLCLQCLSAWGEQEGVEFGAPHLGWSLYFPVHMPGLELTQPVEDGEDIEIDADMVDLAEHANSFFALGVGYGFRAWNDHYMWFDLNGWHGGYQMEMDDLTADSDVALPPILEEFLDVNVEMKQRIVQGEYGVLILEGWNRLDLGIFSGLRYYDQKIKVFGEIPAWNGECGLIGCFEALPFREKQESSWSEFILGLKLGYRWHKRNSLIGSFSWGHEESSRIQVINTLSFRESWFTSLGWRRDEFVNDGVEIVESGLYFEIGKRF